MARGQETGNHPNRQVHRDRFNPSPLYGGSMDAEIATQEARNVSEQLTGLFTPFKSFNQTREPHRRWPGEKE